MQFKYQWQTYILIASGVLLVTFQNCSQSGIISAVTDPAAVQNGQSCTGEACQVAAPLKLNVVSSAGYVCEPFGNQPVVDEKSGLKAQLSYLKVKNSDISDADRNTYNAISVLSYFKTDDTRFQIASEPIYFSQINTPTRIFNTGFMNDQGNYLMSSTGEKLIEYFALKYETVLKLNNNQEEGQYELASLSDDGFILEAKINGEWTTLIKRDTQQSTRMNCDSRAKLSMKKDSKIPLRIHYFQGPRTRIANVFMWRKVGSNLTSLDADCGVSEDNYFFNSKTSQPNTPYNDLINRGWSVIATSNFEIPNQEVNPCAFSQEDVVSDLNVALADSTNQSQAPDLKVDLKTSLMVSISATLFNITSGTPVAVKSLDVTGATTDHSLIIPQVTLSEGKYMLEIIMTGNGVKLRKEVDFNMEKTGK